MLTQLINNFSNETQIITINTSIWRSISGNSHLKISLIFPNHKKVQFTKFLSEGNNDLLLQKIKDNIKIFINTDLFTHDIANIKYNEQIYSIHSLKCVTIGNEVIALSNDDESMFLLTSELSSSPINKKELDLFVSQYLCDKVSNIINIFSEEIVALNSFLPICKAYVPNLTISDFEKLQDLTSKINNIFKC